MTDYSLLGPDSKNVKLDGVLDECRRVLASFIATSPEEIVFTQSITHGINIIAEGFDFFNGDNIVLREADKEHVSNFLPWLKKSKSDKKNLYITGSDELGNFDLGSLENYMKDHPGGIISVAHALYNIGTILPIPKISEIAHKYGYLVFVDAGQTAGAMPVDVKKLDCDFFAFSAYKWICGTPGIGVLYIRKEIQKHIKYYGLDVRSIKQVKIESRVFLDFDRNGFKQREGPYVYEAGFRNYTCALGLMEAIKLLTNYGLSNIRTKNLELMKYAQKLLSEIHGLVVYGPKDYNDRSAILSFNIEGYPPEKIVDYLSANRVILATREIGKVGVARISPHYYNTKEQILTAVNLIKNFYEKQRKSA